MSEHRHFDESELLEFALTRRDAASVACAQCAARVLELHVGLSRVRDVLAASSASPSRPEQSSLAERVLARTTREALDWRGDVKLVLAYARGRLRGSMWLRAAAAILVIHFAALPVLAWIVLRAPQPPKHFNSSIEPLPRKSVFADDPDEVERSLQTELPDAEPALIEVEASAAPSNPLVRDDVRAAIAYDAQRLRQFALPAADAPAPQGLFAKLLWARARQLQTDEWPRELLVEVSRLGAAGSSAQPSAAECVSLRALAVEIRLDRFVLRGEDREGVEAACQALAREASKDSDLARLALARAARLGVVFTPTTAVQDRDVLALDSRWLEALDGHEALRLDPYAARWSALRR